MGRSRQFEARYGGRCGLCDDRIEEGELVEFYDDELCHSECVDDELGGGA